MVVRAGRDIKKGEDITHSYVDAQVTLSVIHQRYEQLAETLIVLLKNEANSNQCK